MVFTAGMSAWITSQIRGAEKINGFPVTPKISHTHTHTHAPPACGAPQETKELTDVHVCSQKGQEDEDMKRDTTGQRCMWLR